MAGPYSSEDLYGDQTSEQAMFDRAQSNLSESSQTADCTMEAASDGGCEGGASNGADGGTGCGASGCGVGA